MYQSKNSRLLVTGQIISTKSPIGIQRISATTTGTTTAHVRPSSTTTSLSAFLRVPTEQNQATLHQAILHLAELRQATIRWITLRQVGLGRATLHPATPCRVCQAILCGATIGRSSRHAYKSNLCRPSKTISSLISRYWCRAEALIKSPQVQSMTVHRNWVLSRVDCIKRWKSSRMRMSFRYVLSSCSMSRFVFTSSLHNFYKSHLCI